MAGRSHIVLSGSDGLAIRVLDELVALGEDVVVVVGDREHALADRAAESGVTVVVGDFRRDEALQRAEIGEAAALALLDDDDVGNIGAALVAQEHNAGLHLVVRMFNIELGRSLELLFEDCRILSAAALAAPAFADAAIHGQTGQSVRVCGNLLEVRDLAGDDPRIVAGLMARDEQGDEQLFPDGAKRILALVAGAEEKPGDRHLRQAASMRKRLGAHLGSFGRLFDKRLAVLAGALVAIIAVSSAVFEQFHHLSWIDALYFTITTITTTGYGDINLAEAGTAVKLYGAAVMIVGALTVALLFALVTDAIVGVRLARTLGESPRPERDHVVVCGLGNIGYRVVERLVERRVPCIAVEHAEDARFVLSARRLGVPVVIADASRPETLAGLRLEHATCLMAVTSDDIANLETALAARAIRPQLRIVLRLFDADLAERVERRFDIHISRSVSALAAPAFVAALLERRMIAVLAIGRRALAVTEVAVEPGSAAAQSNVGELERRCECRVLSIGDRFAPAASDPVEEGRLIVVASPAGLRAVNAEAAAQEAAGSEASDSGTPWTAS